MPESSKWAAHAYFIEQGGDWWYVTDDEALDAIEAGKPPCRQMSWAEWWAGREGNGRGTHDGKPLEAQRCEAT